MHICIICLVIIIWCVCTCCAGVKQPSLENLIEDKTYVFFSHTIKAQPENMPLLDAVLDKVYTVHEAVLHVEDVLIVYLCSVFVLLTMNVYLISKGGVLLHLVNMQV